MSKADIESNKFNEDLIEAIKQYPNLWEKGTSEYRDSEMSKNSWDAVSAIVGKSIDECKTRWRTLRDSYRKVSKEYIPSGSGRRKRKSFAYSEVMSFLSQSQKKPKTSTNFEDDEKDSRKVVADKPEEFRDKGKREYRQK